MTTPRMPFQPILIQLFGAGQVQQVVQLAERLGIGRAARPEFVAQRARAFERRRAAVQQATRPARSRRRRPAPAR